MAAPWTIPWNCLFPLSRLASVGLQTFACSPDTPCNFPPPPRKLSLGSANLEGFRISISTYSYNPLLLLRSWRMNTSPSGYIFVDDDAVLDGVASLFSKGFEFRCFAPSGKYDVFRCIDFVKLECRPRSSWEGQKGFWFLIQGSRIRRYFSLFSFFSPILAYVYILFQLYMNKNLVFIMMLSLCNIKEIVYIFGQDIFPVIRLSLLDTLKIYRDLIFEIHRLKYYFRLYENRR